MSRQGLRFLVGTLFFTLMWNSHVFGSDRIGPFLAKKFSVMTYNAENLFDSLHDEGKKDYSYLPLEVKAASQEVQDYCRSMRSGYYKERCFNLDWTAEVVGKKIMNLSKVIRSVNEGKGPDILILQEIENQRVLDRLVNEGLAKLGYVSSLLVEGPDKRGIDVAIVSRYPLHSPVKYHDIDLSPVYDNPDKVKLTRGVLEATFKIHGKLFSILSNHWPSQRNPDETRVIAAQTMIKAALKAPGYVIMGGDFNVMPSDEPHSINNLMLNPKVKPYFYDAEKVFFGEQLDHLFKPHEGNFVEHRGTHFYRGKWSSLDRFFVMKKQVESCGLFTSCFRPIWQSYYVVKHPFMLHDVTYRDRDTGDQVTYRDVPQRYDDKTGEGYSDHLPAYMEFSVR